MRHTTPNSINKDVLEFCEEINSSNKPFFIKVIPYEEAEIQECFPNVESYVKKFGGRSQQGWTIWETEKKFIEAEFHAVWVGEDGSYIDITPKPDGEEEILFLRDDKSEVINEPVSNIRKVLLDTAEFRVKKVIWEKFFELSKKYWDGSKSEIPEFELVKLARFEKELLSSEIQKDKLSGKAKVGRNEPCPCGSEIKYKKCCMDS